MTTQEMTISKARTQISAGVNDVTAQFYTTADVCRAAEMPPRNHPALRVRQTILTFIRPDKVWVRTVYEDNSVVTIW